MSLRKSNEGTTERRAFASWQALLDQVSKPMSPDVPGSSTMPEQDKWSWTETYEEAMGLAQTGWADGFKAISLKADSIANATGGLELTSRYTEAGDEVDVGLCLTGEPECMIEYPMEPRRRPVVRFVVSVSFSAGVESDAIYNRGAAVLAAIDLLEGNGVRVEVDLDHSIENGGNKFRRTVRLKNAEDSMDRDKMAFAICHASTLRRLFFRLYEQSGLDYFRKCGGMSYGMPINPEDDATAVVVPAMKSGFGFYTMEESTEFAQTLIAEAMGQAK